MGLQQHFPRDFGAEFEAGERAYALEMKAKVDGRQTDEAARGVHDAVVVGEGHDGCAAEGVSCEEGDGGKGEVEDCVEHLWNERLIRMA